MRITVSAICITTICIMGLPGAINPIGKNVIKNEQMSRKNLQYKKLPVKTDASVAQAALKTQKDPLRPVYHLTSAANWNNDTAGPMLGPAQEAVALKKEEVQLVESLMREFPTSADPIVLMGNVHGHHGNTTEAVKFWKKGLALNPKRTDVYVGMGWYAMRKGQYNEAIGHWRKALQINPQIPSVHNYIARALIILGRQKEAVEELERDIESSESSLSYFLLGQEYLQQKQYEKAREKYEKAIVLQPTLTNAYYGLFTVYTRLKQDAKAKEYMDIFKKLKAEDTVVDNKDLTDRSDAVGDLAVIRKNAAQTYMEAERIYRAQGNLTRAEQLLERAAILDPTNFSCLMKLASVYRKSNRIPEALQIYQRMSKIEPKNPTNYLNIGTFSVQLKRFYDAEEAFRKAIRLSPEDSNAYRELAQLYLKMDTKFLEARLLAEKAVALEPIAANYFVLSWACDKNEDTANSLSAMKRAIELDPNNPSYKRMYELIRNRN